ncbi:GNAT family N-acetyltransferase [Streptacidiphilus sp. EB129]|uniref:GNAT family N-acetyltransferase n=1 Tax=Streptacidiphilus sp. EB129 TaxID=3156262 RepID=UPI00351857C8
MGEVARTGRVELREILPAEAENLAAGGSGGIGWVPDGPYRGTRDACTGMTRAVQAGGYEPAWGVFAIIRLEDGAAVGGIGFHGPPSDGVAEIGYDLAASARGNGYATEAARLLVARALARPGVSHLIAHTEPGNTASQAVLTRVGFERDGVGADDLYRFVLRGGSEVA